MGKTKKAYLTHLMLILFYSFFVSLADGVKNIATDEDALLALKARITQDPNNILATNWSTTASVCNWVGVTCGARHDRVTALDLSDMGLTGTIPSHLGNLSFLVFISFDSNSFHGSLPNELSKLRRMKTFRLSSNNFSGEIPSWIGSFAQLQDLSLDSNNFKGVIPTSLFNLSKLNSFGLSSNNLQGYIPEAIENLHSLRQVDLSNNNFSGFIPSGIFNISSLQEIDFSSNGLSGSMPDILDNNTISLLQILDFGINSLTGPLPPNMFTNLPDLEELYLSSNQFSGPIPTTLIGCTKLRALSLSVNHFEGSMHKDIGNLTMLQFLYLNQNNFNGTEIPTSIGNIVYLEEMNLQTSGLIGSIPSSIGNMSRLQFLCLSNNGLTGTIPNEIGNLANLEQLILGTNNLVGHVPSGIYNTSKMIRISLVLNQLSGHLPSNLGLHLPNLEELYTGMNNFTGPIPITISNASNLRIIDFPSNSFSGTIPDELGNLRSLEQLSLGGNHLTMKSLSSGLSLLSSLTNCKDLRILSLGDNPLNGTFPISIGNLSSSLEEFWADSCEITGTIPREIGNLSSLILLVLSSNDLRGTIPTTIGTLRNLQDLELDHNRLEGSFPFELCHLQSLAYLSASLNSLSGQIPSCLGDVVSLRYIYMDMNKFNSKIPSTLWKLEDILELNLSFNSVSGSLPVEIGNLKAVTLIDLSGNLLSGQIPPSFGNLKDLSSLSLANNRLEGSIPQSFGDVINLQFFDLSNNSFSGEIPKSLEKLRYLTYFNVSFNELQGEIPNGGAFKNLSARSFLGNEGLCGAAIFQVQACKNSTHHQSKATSKLALRYGLLTTGLTILSLGVIVIFFRRRRKRNKRAPAGYLLPLATLKRISYLELEQATNKFNEMNLLGRGSFGSVYKGTLSDGTTIAVKVFNLQVEGAFKSFDVECEVLRMIRHRNLVKIITSCCNIDFKALVLGFMPNFSLEKWLHSPNYFLELLQRLNIMLHVALALEYLHHGYASPIVHCDLKPSNILLDEDMIAHVSDFGIAKLLGEEHSFIQTITLATVGYMAPEYGSEGVVSTRGDMYSYGILLMETFTRRKPTDEMFNEEMNMKQWVKESLPGGVTQIADETLLKIEERHFSAKKDCISSIMQLAIQCSSELPEQRPDIRNVLNTLNHIKKKLLKDSRAPCPELAQN